jgi:hypothetical protein
MACEARTRVLLDEASRTFYALTPPQACYRFAPARAVPGAAEALMMTLADEPSPPGAEAEREREQPSP